MIEKLAVPRIVITGFGLVTPLGGSAWETFAALLAGRSIADRAAKLPEDVAAVDLVRAVGAVSIAQHSPSDPAVELAERAGREALTMAGVSGDEVGGLPCIIATSKGAVHALTAAAEKYARRGSGKRLITGTTAPPPADAHRAVTLGPQGYLTHHLRRRLKLGDTTHLVAACASSLIALHRARLMLQSTLAPPRSAPQRVLILSCDAALLPAFIHAYQRLGVLAPLNAAQYRGAPLDQSASGFMIAEAGAAVVLERVDDDAPLPRCALELIDSSEACDAFDLIRPCADMPALRHLAASLLRDRDIDLIHPHATGTPGTPPHDTAELRALLPQAAASLDLPSTLAPPRPDLYAHKGALGHTLGASGLISTVLACLCARTQRRPPMPWITAPIAPHLTANPPGLARPIRTQAVFAAGFAGHAAGVVLRSPSPDR